MTKLSKAWNNFSWLWIELGFVWTTMSIGRRAVFDMKYTGIMRIMTKRIKCEKKERKEKKIKVSPGNGKGKAWGRYDIFRLQKCRRISFPPPGNCCKTSDIHFALPCPCGCERGKTSVRVKVASPPADGSGLNRALKAEPAFPPLPFPGRKSHRKLVPWTLLIECEFS